MKNRPARGARAPTAKATQMQRDQKKKNGHSATDSSTS